MDQDTKAAIRVMLRGNGPQRTGTYVVTVNGGRIVGLAPIGNKVPASKLRDQTAGKLAPPTIGEPMITRKRVIGTRQANPLNALIKEPA